MPVARSWSLLNLLARRKNSHQAKPELSRIKYRAITSTARFFLARIMEIFDYDNILLLPRKCRVESRSECDASVELGPRRFRLPVVPANMKTVVSEAICIWMAQNNYFYVMHRFDLDNVKFVQDMKALGLYASISLGVKPPDYATVDRLVALGLTPEYITIDIAHGHADSVKNMIGYLREKIPGTFIIAGNVATPEAVIDLENWGADATKVGIGPGKVCITKLKTGFGTGGWQLSAVKWCARVATKPIIAEPLLVGEIFDTGEGVLAHADAVAAILKGIGGSEAMQAASYLVYVSDHLNKPREVIGKAFGDNFAELEGAG